MRVLGGALKRELTALNHILLDRALFDEAHGLAVAMVSPGLCDGQYVNACLRRAAEVARECGFCDVVEWITNTAAFLTRGHNAAGCAVEADSARTVLHFGLGEKRGRHQSRFDNRQEALRIRRKSAGCLSLTAFPTAQRALVNSAVPLIPSE
jgi:hypothetical protein